MKPLQSRKLWIVVTTLGALVGVTAMHAFAGPMPDFDKVLLAILGAGGAGTAAQYGLDAKNGRDS